MPHLYGAAACLIAAIGCGCSGGSSPTAPTDSTSSAAPAPAPVPGPPPASEAPPVLSVTIVDLSGSYDSGSRRLGSLNCNFVFPNDVNDRWCFNAFGAQTLGKAVPSYDYKVAAGSNVFAAAAGTVTRIEAEINPLYPDEFEIETRAFVGGTYLVIYDHVKNLRVALGSTVTAGMLLGTAGIHTSNRNVYGRVELQVNRVLDRATGRSEALCPRTFGTGGFNQLQDAALAAHNSANPQFAYSSVCLAERVQS